MSKLPVRSRLALPAVAVLVAASAFLQACGGDAPPPQHGATPVSVAPAVQKTVTDTEEFSGRLEAIDFVELHPRVSGTIDSVHFADGAMVKKGDLLFTIDPRPFTAELARAQAQLASAKSSADLARTQLARSQKLFDQQAASKQEVDQLTSGQNTSQADIQSAEAAVRLAALNVEWTQVRAPIAGRVSRAAVREGNLVSDQTLLTTIAGVQRVYAYFDVSEGSFLKLKNQSKAEGKAPAVRMALSNETDFPHVGKVDFVDNRLDDQTGAIRVRAAFDNSKGELVPGLAARIRLDSPVSYDAVLVPDRAIGTDQSKKLVFVVGDDNVPQVRPVTLGALFGRMRVVTGVKAGENVVVDGVQRIRPGSPVQPQVLQVDADGMPIPAPPPQGAPGGQGGGAAPEKKS